MHCFCVLPDTSPVSCAPHCRPDLYLAVLLSGLLQSITGHRAPHLAVFPYSNFTSAWWWFLIPLPHTPYHGMNAFPALSQSAHDSISHRSTQRATLGYQSVLFSFGRYIACLQRLAPVVCYKRYVHLHPAGSYQEYWSRNLH